MDIVKVIDDISELVAVILAILIGLILILDITLLLYLAYKLITTGSILT